jgi:hypothetical protein
MTQFQLDCAVADAIGEPEPAVLDLVVVCPHCIHAVPHAGLAGDGSLALAEGLLCDVLFDVAPDAIFATAPANA